MRIRPWPIVILAAIQILAPLINIAYSAWLMRTSIHRYLWLTFSHHQWEWAGSLSFFLGFPIAGIAIYRCNRWSYPIFITVMGWALYSNFETWRNFGQYFGLRDFLLANLLNFGLVSYFLIPAVREVYFNPRIRWWEAKPRYDCRLQTRFPGGEGTATNLSEGGIYVEAPEQAIEGLRIGAETVIRFQGSSGGTAKEYVLDARVVRVREALPTGCAFQLIHTPESLQAVRGLIRELREAGAQERLGNVDLIEEFKSWFFTAVTTGKGLVPPKR